MRISRRRFMKLTSEVSACALASAFISPKSLTANEKTAKDKRPNILFILSDDHSAPYLGCYNHPDLKTPNLDSIAADGARFNRAYTTAPQCVPSRASLMTGRSAVDIRMTRFTAPLPADIISFPEILKKAGYYTGLVGRTYHLDGPYYKSEPEVSRRVFEKHNLRTFARRVDYIKDGADKDNVASITEFLDNVPEGRPFFLQLGFSDPHRPWEAKDYEPNPNSITIPETMPDVPSVRTDLAAYYGEIQRLDGNIGQILEIIDKRGLKDSTMVVFMGDNGAALIRGKGTLYEYGLNVPLLIRWPGHIKPSTVCDVLISGEDIAPTFLEAAGVSALKEMTGISFMNAIRGKPFEGHKYVFAERGSHASLLPTDTAAFDLGRCVISKRYKLIYNALWQLPYEPVDMWKNPMWEDLKRRHDEKTIDPKFSKVLFAEQRPMFEVYDLEKDPYEFNNLAGTSEFAEVENKLKEALQEWMILNQDYLPLPIKSR